MTQEEQEELLNKIWNDGKWGDYCNPNKFYDLTPPILFYHINNLLKSRQEMMIEAMENLRDKYKPAYEEIDKGIVIGLDKGIEVINTCKEINKII